MVQYNMSNSTETASIVATDAEHLKVCVEQAISQYGSTCSLNHIDVSRITDMRHLFNNSPFNGDISQWDVSNVNTFARMFKDSAFNGNISQWRLERADNLLEMFAGSQFNGDITKWDLRKIKESRQMFQGAAYAGDLSKTELRRYSTFADMFDAGFKGVLPFIGELSIRSRMYAAMLGGSAPLRQYLKTVPFNTVHADILLDSPKKPGWASIKDYAWVKQQEYVAKSLGMPLEEMRYLLVHNYHTQKYDAIQLPKLDYD